MIAMRKRDANNTRRSGKGVGRRRPADPAAINEATFEARLAALLRSTIPWLADIRHQWQFSLQLGHTRFEVDGRRSLKLRGRADLVLIHNERPLAVLELKAPGVAISDDDRKQGLSYARLLESIAPLVIVSNGTDTEIYSTWTGDRVLGQTLDEDVLKKAMSSAAAIAASQSADAIATLLGPASAVACGLINTLTAAEIADMTGPLSDGRRPFAENLLFPRKMTAAIELGLQDGARGFILTGSPLIGKSNVLRELSLRYAARDDVAVLFVEGGSAHHGVFRVLANAFARELGWPATTEDVRSWLQRISHAGRMRLIIAIDDVDAAEMGPELDELASNAYGPNVQLVLTCASGQVDRLTRNRAGGDASRLGRMASVRELDELDDQEFGLAAARTLAPKRIQFMRGAQHAREYRSPWVLRAIVASVAEQSEHADETLSAAIPSLPGLQLMKFAERQFDDRIDLRGKYASFACALLEDVEESYSSLLIALISSFVCLRESLLRHISEAELQSGIERGEFKPVLLKGDVRAIVAQLPELAALSLARQIGARLAAKRSESPEVRAEQLVTVCSRVIFGDVIGAMALMEAAHATDGLPSGLIARLLEWAPEEEAVGPGAKFAWPLSIDQHAEIDVRADGGMVVKLPDGTRRRLQPDSEGLGVMYGRMTPWLILSYLAAVPLAAIDSEGNVVGWADPDILVQLGSSPIVLQQPRGPFVVPGLVHDIEGVGSIVCFKEGIVEPITLAIMQAMAHDMDRGDYLVDEAVEMGSIPLLARVHIALEAISEFREAERRKWARALINKKIKPALAASQLLH
jgi:hypothetical protein